MNPVDSLIDSSVRCGRCGMPGVGTCYCWTRCSCGWWAEKGRPCRNPGTTRCSTKLRYAEVDPEGDTL